MVLAVVLGVLGFLAAIFLTVFGVYAHRRRFGGHAADMAAHGAASARSSPSAAVARGPLRYGEQLCNHYLAFKLLALVRDRVFAAHAPPGPGQARGPAARATSCRW